MKDPNPPPSRRYTRINSNVGLVIDRDVAINSMLQEMNKINGRAPWYLLDLPGAVYVHEGSKSLHFIA